MISKRFLERQLAQGGGKLGGGNGPKIKRGDEILDGPYPKSFTEFIGQGQARLRIMSAMNTAQVMGQPLGHMLLAAGDAGVGKTSLANITAYHMGAGIVELSGLVTDKDAAKALRVMQDGDVLLLDEIHRLFSSGKSRAEWLLTLMQDGELHMSTGVVVAPNITIIGATTDKEKLPLTILDRFVVKPVLAPYTVDEAAKIALYHAKSLGFGTKILPMPRKDDWLLAVAEASKCNPRRIRQLLSTVRDTALSDPDVLTKDGYNITQALAWDGLTRDGLNRVAQDYLMGLLAYGGTAALPTLKALLNEEQLVHTEKALIQEGFIEVSGRGRSLTDFGSERAQQLAVEQVGAAS